MAPKKGKEKVQEAARPPSYILEVLPPAIASLDIGDRDNIAAKYEECVKTIRTSIADATDVKYSFLVGGERVTVPVTPGQNFTAAGTYAIELKHNGESLYLVASKYMSWFKGIATRKGLRFEIDEKPRGPKIMKDSHSLGHNGMYTDLVPGEHIAHLKLGYQRLLWAFFILARLGEQKKRNSKDESIAFTIMALMFFEGPRFVDVCDFFKRVLTQDANIELGESNQKQIGDWCDCGTRFYTEKGDERAEPILISHNTSEDVKVIPKKLRIMCRSSWDKWMEAKGDESKSSSSSRKG